MTSAGASQVPARCAGCAFDLPAGARFCPRCGAEQRAPLTARRVTSVLFGDLVGFTTLAEGRDPEEVRELLTRYFDDARRIVAGHGGLVEKFIGDAVMAVWGVPTAHEDDAERAVRAGLEIVAAVASLREEIGLPELDIRIGVVTGEVAVTLGATAQGMVAGDPVNTASRVQSAAAPGEVWVDDTTRLLTYRTIDYASAGSRLLKGKREPTALWAVRGVLAGVGGRRTDGPEAPLTGRDRELRLITDGYHRTEQARRPGLVLVSGDPGLGKTRLGGEFARHCEDLAGTVRWLEGRCAAYGDAVPYYALAEAFRGRLRSLGDERGAGTDDPAALLDLCLEEFVADPEERDWIRPRLGVLLLGSEGSFQQQDLFGAWATFLARLVGDAAAVVLLVDDAEHADDGFITFVQHLLSGEDLPLYVVLLARPDLIERHPALAGDPRASVVGLSPLAETEMAALVDGLVGGLPDATRDALVRRADGVPLFAIETVRSLIDRDLVVARQGRYVLADRDADLAAVGAPATLHALVASRLDRLEPAQRSVIDDASVLGQEFTREQLGALRGGRAEPPDDDLDGVLADLEHRQLIRRDTNRLGSGFGRYGFVQDAVRQTAYRMLGRRDRRAAHLRVADHFGDDAGELAPLVARHLIGAAEAVPNAPDVADLRRRARSLLVTASHRTLSLGLATGAVDQLTAAIALCDDDLDRARIESLLARAYGTERSFAEQEKVAARALAVLDAHGEPESAALAAGHLGFALDATGRSEAAIALLRARWDAMVERDADEAVCLVGRYLVLALQHAGRHQEIVPVALTTMAAAERTADDLAVLRLLEGLSLAFLALRLPRLAQGFATLVVRETDQRGFHGTEFAGQTLLAVQAMRHDLPAARRRIDDVDELIERSRLYSSRGWLTMDRLLLELSTGDWSAVDAAYDAFADLVEPLELGSYAFVGIRVALARGEPLRPDWVAATRATESEPEATLGALLAHGLVLGADRTGSDLAALADRIVRRAAVEQGNDEFVLLLADCADLVVASGSADAIGSLLDLLPASDTDRTVEVAFRAHRARLRALHARLDGAETAVVEAQLREAIAAYDAWGARLWARRTAAELAALLAGDGRVDEAAELLEPVRELFERIGAGAWLAALPPVP